MAGCSWWVGNATSIPTDVWNFQLKVDLILIHDDGGGFINLVTNINSRDVRLPVMLCFLSWVSELRAIVRQRRKGEYDRNDK